MVILVRLASTSIFFQMAGRFQGKTVPTGRMTPSALGSSATITSTTSSISSSTHTIENDQTYLGQI